MSASELTQILAVAIGSALVVGGMGLAASWMLRRRSLRWHLSLLVAVAVLAPFVGLLLITRAMFLSGHDLTVATYVSSAAAVVTLVVAFGMGEAIARWADALRSDVLRLGTRTGIGSPATGPREFRELNAALRHAQADLEQAKERERMLDRARRDLVSWVSHDLRTPLAGVRAMTEALEDGMALEPGRYLTQIRRDVDRMTSMVDDLFELSRIHAGVLVARVEPVVLRDLISEAIASADPVARARGVQLGGAVDADVQLNADPAALSRAISNLVMNAIRHTPEDGSVQVRAGHVGEMVEVSVVDGCDGIPAEELESVFEVGWRGSTARTPETDAHAAGAGLGLAIVRGIVEAHQGEVMVENLAPGPGCRFLIRLPLAAAAKH